MGRDSNLITCLGTKKPTSYSWNLLLELAFPTQTQVVIMINWVIKRQLMMLTLFSTTGSSSSHHIEQGLFT
ncbi:hypothetical protein AHAS_Ahas20G0203100 [Arachis hypogaea]